jgi:RNA polymerase sigma-70 factor, ECF subfamily
MDIKDLVAEIKKGNTEAFAEVYDLYSDRIFRFVKLKVSNQSQAEDIVQDVFVKAWKGCESLPLDKLQFSSWLYKIASNTVNDYFRKMYRTPDISPLESGMELASGQSIEAEVNMTFDLARVRDALSGLPSQYRQVLELRFSQDFTIAETADILGKSSLAVRLLQHRALNKLHTIINSNSQEGYEKV